MDYEWISVLEIWHIQYITWRLLNLDTVKVMNHNQHDYRETKISNNFFASGNIYKLWFIIVRFRSDRFLNGHMDVGDDWSRCNMLIIILILNLLTLVPITNIPKISPTSKFSYLKLVNSRCHQHHLNRSRSKLFFEPSKLKVTFKSDLVMNENENTNRKNSFVS